MPALATVLSNLVAAGYVLAALQFLARGFEKLVAPHHLSRVLDRAGLERLARPRAIRALAAAEFSIGVLALGLGLHEELQRVALILVVLHLAVVTPIGVLLAARTGDCGCTGTAGRGATHAESIAGLILRNAIISACVAAAVMQQSEISMELVVYSVVASAVIAGSSILRLREAHRDLKSVALSFSMEWRRH